MTPSSPTPEQDVLARYLEIATERDNLAQLHLTATDAVKPVIGTALSAAEDQLAAFESQKGTRRALTEIGEQVARSLSEIDALAGAVELGLITEDVVAAQREAILGDERNRRALDFMQRAGLLEGAGVSVVSVPVPKQVEGRSVEQKEQKTAESHIAITIHGNGVQIGKNGKFVRLAGAGVELRDQRDYSEERKTVLKVLVANAGKELTVGELWETAFPGVEYDYRAMAQIRKWLETLTYRRSQIVAHNEKRGPSSAYSIPNPNVTVAEVVTTRPTVKQHEVAPVVVEETMPLAVQPSEATPVAAEAQPVVEVKQEPVLPVNFPLNQAESAILAEFLELKKDLLDAFDIPVMGEGVADQIHAGLKTSKVAETMSIYGGDLSAARKAIIAKVHEYFMDEDKVMDDITNMSERDYRYKLFEYLFTFDFEDRIVLLEKLATSVPVTEVSIQNIGGAFTSGVVITGTSTEHLDEHGQPLLGEDADPSYEHALSATEEDAPDDLTRTPIYFDLSFQGVDSAAAEQVDPEETGIDDGGDAQPDEAESVADQSVESEKGMPEWLTEFISEVHAQIELFEKDGLMDSPDGVSRKVMNVKSSSAIMGTDTNLERGVSKNIIKQSRTGRRSDDLISMSAWICLALQNSNPQVFTNRSRCRQAVAEVDKIIAGYFAKRAREAQD